MKILLIGGAGHVGSAIAKYLRSNNHQVLIWDRLDRGIGRNGTNCGLMVGDESRLLPMIKVFQNELSTYDRVIWTSGQADVSYCEAHPEEAYVGNVINLFNLVRECNIPILYTSSVAVYENNGRPNNTYAKSKLMLDNLLIEAFPRKSFTSIRMGTVIGVSPNMKDTLSVHAMVKKGIETRQIDIFGEHILRPMLYIPDLLAFVGKWIYEPQKGIYPLYSEIISFGDIAQNIIQFVEDNMSEVWKLNRINKKVIINCSIYPTRTDVFDVYGYMPDRWLIDVLPTLYKHYKELNDEQLYSTN